MLACPVCGALVHSEELKRLRGLAENANAPVEALSAWRRALALLPENSRQHAVIVEKVKALVGEVDKGGGAGLRRDSASGKKKGILASAAAAVVLAVTKFKFALIFLLTKGKLLLLGLLNGATLLSMFASFGAYWSIFGWMFAAGLVLAIYVHEMGHVAALHKFGIRASAPMFIPGIGAVVRLQERLHSPIENARVGLAGPWWGLGATIALWLAGTVLGSPLAFAVAHVSAWINLLNLTPVWQLDGSRAFSALSRRQRWVGAAALFAVFLATGDGIVMLASAIAVFRAFGKDAAEKGDTRTLLDFCLLAGALGLLMIVSKPDKPPPSPTPSPVSVSHLAVRDSRYRMLTEATLVLVPATLPL